MKKLILVVLIITTCATTFNILTTQAVSDLASSSSSSSSSSASSIPFSPASPHLTSLGSNWLNFLLLKHHRSHNHNVDVQDSSQVENNNVDDENEIVSNNENNNNNKVVGGEEDWSSEYSFQVSVTDLGVQHICGGVILNANTVLTAAHCVYGRNINRLMIPAESTFAGIRYTTRVEQVNTIEIHPQYNPATLANNIALLTIAPLITLDAANADVLMQRAVKQIRLPTVGQKFTDFATLVGYGSISVRSPREETAPRKVSLPITSLSRCRSLYGQNLITSGMLCAGESYTGKGLCQGDAGSGLTQHDAQLDAEILIGIGSFGFECGSGRYPSVFTAVADYVEWIREKVPNLP